MLSRLKQIYTKANDLTAAAFAGVAKRFPHAAKFLGIVRSRRRPLLILFFLLMHIIGFFMSVQAVMQTRTEQGAVAWAISLNTIPVVAVPGWIVFGDSRINTYTTVRRAGLEKVRPLAQSLIKNIEAAEASRPSAGPTMKALERFASMPTLHGNAAELLIDGKETFDSIFQAIDEAEKYILVQFYILRSDRTGTELKNRLAAKAAQGVRIYVLLDDMGCLDLGNRYVKELRAAGIDARFFMDFSGQANRFQLNFRNHRKLVVIDGKKVFIGGHNVGDEYLGKDPVMTPWRDTHVVMTGPVARAAQISFVEDWHWATETLLEDLEWQITREDFTGNMEAIVLPSGPADAVETCSMFFLSAINNATKRVWIATPYFVPDDKIVTALQMAALRGVEVKILIPETTDSRLVQLSSWSYLEPLEATGVEIYRYTRGFMHQKVVLVDDDLAAIGSANFDNRSFRLNFELTAIIRDVNFAGKVAAMLENDLSHSRKALAKELKERSFVFKLAVRLARLLAPVQ
ncbi:MAG: cardiolipin synthase [Verrucomicrobiales bacterium]|nr:cardiolipin synthase [Verrucomicrobiales bacterium]